MKYYIQSAGKSPSAEYQWYLIKSSSELNPESPPYLEAMNDLLDTDSFSLAILRQRENNHLCLLVTRLESNRSDFQGRTIFNYIYLQSNSESEDNRIQILAAQFLSDRNKISSEINDKVIESIEEEPGFRINEAAFTQLVQAENKQEHLEGVHTDTGYIAHKSIENQQDLASKLLDKKLPNSPGILVVVTQYQSKELLVRESSLCWGLSDLIEDKSWTALIKEAVNIDPVVDRTSQEKDRKLIVIEPSIKLLVGLIYTGILIYILTGIDNNPSRPTEKVMEPTDQQTIQDNKQANQTEKVTEPTDQQTIPDNDQARQTEKIMQPVDQQTIPDNDHFPVSNPMTQEQ